MRSRNAFAVPLTGNSRGESRRQFIHVPNFLAFTRDAGRMCQTGVTHSHACTHTHPLTAARAVCRNQSQAWSKKLLQNLFVQSQLGAVLVGKGESAKGIAGGGGTARVQREIPMLLFVAVCLGNFLIH